MCSCSSNVCTYTSKKLQIKINVSGFHGVARIDGLLPRILMAGRSLGNDRSHRTVRDPDIQTQLSSSALTKTLHLVTCHVITHISAYQIRPRITVHPGYGRD
jgi:hypothetical protein